MTPPIGMLLIIMGVMILGLLLLTAAPDRTGVVDSLAPGVRYALAIALVPRLWPL